jgi:hypothetical protein
MTLKIGTVALSSIHPQDEKLAQVKFRMFF